MTGYGRRLRFGKGAPLHNAVRSALFLVVLLTTELQAQTKCPALPEGTVCDHFHYHFLLWEPSERTYLELKATRQFSSMEACEKWRADATKESQSIADYMKLSKIDTSMQADHLGDCHCDRTMDASSGVFLDDKARMSQLRVEQERAWFLRERLLASDLPAAGDYIKLLFGREPRLDRIFRETMPAHLPKVAARPATAALLDTQIGKQSETPPIAAKLLLAEVTVPVGGVGASASVEPAQTAPPPTQDFFTSEQRRADAILAAAENIADTDTKSAVRREIMRRKRALDNLGVVRHTAETNGVIGQTLDRANDEASGLAVVRRLFGEEIASAWAPPDVRDVARTRRLGADANAALVLDRSADPVARRIGLYGLLGREHRFSAEESASFVVVVEELLKK